MWLQALFIDEEAAAFACGYEYGGEFMEGECNEPAMWLQAEPAAACDEGEGGAAADILCHMLFTWDDGNPGDELYADG